MLKKSVSIIMIVIMISLQFAVIAATSSDLQQQKNEIKNNINQAEQRQDQIEGQISSTKSELQKLNDEISKKEYEVEQITMELVKLNDEVDKLTKQLAEAEKNYNEQYDKLCKRLAAQYKRGTVSYLDVLLSSSTLSEFISNYYIIGKIAELDTELLDDIEEQKRTISTAKSEMEVKQAAVKDKQSKLKVEELTLSNKIANKSKYISQLSAEEQELEKEIDKYNKQLKQVDQEIAKQAAASAGGHVYTGGQLEWPVPVYSRISSYFGYRGSAATGGVGTANHNGYDIAAPHYSDIVAAEAGTVIKVVSGCTHDYPKTFKTRCYCGGGYGNYFMIDHGGLVTLYGHVASINVSVGQKVNRGDKVASVGSCGWSTGYHLHFSVINSKGTYVNPGDYLGK